MLTDVEIIRRLGYVANKHTQLSGNWVQGDVNIEKVWNKTQISINYDGANVLSFFQKSMYLIEQFCVVFR